jgi:hypothetical protein
MWFLRGWCSIGMGGGLLIWGAPRPFARVGFHWFVICLLGVWFAFVTAVLCILPLISHICYTVVVLFAIRYTGLVCYDVVQARYTLYYGMGSYGTYTYISLHYKHSKCYLELLLDYIVCHCYVAAHTQLDSNIFWYKAIILFMDKYDYLSCDIVVMIITTLI